MSAKSELRAIEYRIRARDAATAADACLLDRAREQHEQSAARWTALAEDQERRVVHQPNPQPGLTLNLHTPESF